MRAESDAHRPAWLDPSHADREAAQAQDAESCAGSLEQEVLGLYDTYADAISRYVMGVTGNAELSADVVQECFLRYITYRRSGGPPQRRPSWFFREAVQRIRSEELRQERENTEPEQATLAVRDTAQTPEQVCLTMEIRRIALKILAPRELDCLLLRAEGLGYEDIASVLRITSGAVGAMLSRAMHKLQAKVRKK